MMIRVKWAVEKDDVVAQISMGMKTGNTASYSLESRGTLAMTMTEWELFRRTLERGAGRPRGGEGVIVVIEQHDMSPQLVSKDERIF